MQKIQVSASDDECGSNASLSNTENYEEADCQDMEMEEEKTHENVEKHEETKEVVTKSDVIDSSALSDVRFQSPSKTKSVKTQVQTNQFLPMDNCTDPTMDQSSGNSGKAEANNLPFQLGDSQTQDARSAAVDSGRSSETNFSLLESTLQSSSDNLYNKGLSKSNFAIVMESRISNTKKATSNQNRNKDNSSSARKRISVASGVAYEDEISSLDRTQSTAMTQTLLPSNRSEEATGIPSSLFPHLISNPGASSSSLSTVEPSVFSKLPPGATLVGNRGVFATKDLKKPFGCGYCGKVYHKKSSAYGHIIQQHDETPRFSCEFCGKRFGRQSDMSRHLVIHSLAKTFSCHQCGMHFRLKSCHHECTLAENRQFSCKTCNKSFKTRDDFDSHSEVHKAEEYKKDLNDNDLICNICKKVFRLRSSLLKHMIIHSDEKSFSSAEEVSSSKILQCSATTQTLLTSDHSAAAKEVPGSVFLCPSNNNRGSSSTFSSHMVSTVTSKFPPGSVLVSDRGVFRLTDKEKPFACGYCGKAYERKRATFEHIRRQHDEKRYCCEFCGKRFMDEKGLLEHVTMHTQVKSYTCDQCGKQFRFHSGLCSHKYTHSKERPFHCNQCNKSFKSRVDLSRHKECHDNE